MSACGVGGYSSVMRWMVVEVGQAGGDWMIWTVAVVALHLRLATHPSTDGTGAISYGLTCAVWLPDWILSTADTWTCDELPRSPDTEVDAAAAPELDLGPVQNHALRLCLGAFRTSPVTSLHVEANEMPLDLRRRKLAAQYCLKVSADISNPALGCIFNKRFTTFFHRYPSQIRPLGFRVSSDLRAVHFAQKDILPVITPSHPPWLYSKPVLDLSQ